MSKFRFDWRSIILTTFFIAMSIVALLILIAGYTLLFTYIMVLVSG